MTRRIICEISNEAYEAIRRCRFAAQLTEDDFDNSPKLLPNGDYLVHLSEQVVAHLADLAFDHESLSETIIRAVALTSWRLH